MPNTRQKGNQLQNWVEAYLKKKGYIVHNQKPVASQIKTKVGDLIWVSKRNDIYGCIDIEYFHPEEDCIHYAQVTGHSGVGKKLKDLSKIPWNSACIVELWLSKGQGRWVIKRLYGIDYTRTMGIKNEPRLEDYAEIHRGKFMLLKEELPF